MFSSIQHLSRDKSRPAQDLKQQAREILEQHTHFRGRTSLFQ